MRRSALAVTTAITAVLLTGLVGCSGSPATPTTPPATSSSPTPPPTPTTTPTASTDPNAPAGQCADGALAVSVEQVDAGAGSISYNVVFTNTGSSPCELRGAPGVSVVDASGAELGQPAAQVDDDAPATVSVAAGASVTAPLQATNIDPDGGPLDNCPVVQGTGYRVYPPHSFTGFVVEAGQVPACDSDTVFMQVGPVQATA
jgi:hypothetical protein